MQKVIKYLKVIPVSKAFHTYVIPTGSVSLFTPTLSCFGSAMIRDKLLLFLITLLTCFFIVNVVLSAIAGATEGVVFKHRIGDVSKNHTVQVTPEGYTFFIWNGIFSWLISAFVTVCFNAWCYIPSGNNDNGDVAESQVFGRFVTLVLLANAVVYTSWLFLWDNLLMSASAVALTCIAVTNWVALVAFSIGLWKNFYTLKFHNPRQLILYIVLIQNGLAVYTAWTTLAALINITVAFVYDGGVEDTSASLAALVVLTILMTLWMPLELIFWDNYFRYMITPFPVVLWALLGIYIKQSRNRISKTVHEYTLALFIITGCLIVFRIIFMIYRHMKKPLYKELSSSAKVDALPESSNDD